MSGDTEAEPGSVIGFREWLQCKGAYLHPTLKFTKDVSGMSVFTTEEMLCDSRVVSCPFTLAITPHCSKNALLGLSKLCNNTDDQLEALTGRELICTYILMHWVLHEEQEYLDLKRSATSLFGHLPYLNILPSADVLRTSLHFTPEELSLLRGTNLYSATLDREVERQLEWERSRTYAGTLLPVWKDRVTWKHYLTAATYLSSRAFPSTILSPEPSLLPTLSSHPILLPGVDSFNHSRGQPVSWVVDPIHSDVSLSNPLFSPHHDAYQISMVIHKSTPAHTEVFNNYGLKPNSELILGYGFSLPANPDDTIVLKVAGGVNVFDKAWEVGRDARGSEGLWMALITLFSQRVDGGETETTEWECELEAAETLLEMVEHKLMALPRIVDEVQKGVRSDVLQMIRHYVQGQQDIMRSLSAFAHSKRESALAMAKEAGVELVSDEDIDQDDAFQWGESKYDLR